jgi:hypothetical protein
VAKVGCDLTGFLSEDHEIRVDESEGIDDHLPCLAGKSKRHFVFTNDR